MALFDSMRRLLVPRCIIRSIVVDRNLLASVGSPNCRFARGNILLDGWVFPTFANVQFELGTQIKVSTWGT
jgi:hypothetical protein